MAHELPKLGYDNNALEPHIDTRTMAVHHDKHHQAYVNNLNQALEEYEDLQDKSTIELLLDLAALPEEIRTSVRNNGGGHFDHSMFWRCVSPKGGEQPGGGLAGAAWSAPLLTPNRPPPLGRTALYPDRPAATVTAPGMRWMARYHH